MSFLAGDTPSFQKVGGILGISSASEPLRPPILSFKAFKENEGRTGGKIMIGRKEGPFDDRKMKENEGLFQAFLDREVFSDS